MDTSTNDWRLAVDAATARQALASQRVRDLLSGASLDQLKGVLAHLNEQPYTAKIARQRAAVVKELAHRDCALCAGTERLANDIPCTVNHSRRS